MLPTLGVDIVSGPRNTTLPASVMLLSIVYLLDAAVHGYMFCSTHARVCFDRRRKFVVG